MPCPYHGKPAAQLAYRLRRLSMTAAAMQAVIAHLACEHDDAGYSAWSPACPIPTADPPATSIVLSLLWQARNELDGMIESFGGVHPRDRGAP